MKASPKWPNGRQHFPKAVARLTKLLTTPGTLVISVDPATGRRDSACAIAAHVVGSSLPPHVELIACRGAPSLGGALAHMHVEMEAFVQRLDEAGWNQGGVVVAIEELKGKMVHSHLHWAAGVAVMTLAAALNPAAVLEVPIQYWKAHAATEPDYVKGDAHDAIQIGATVTTLAAELAAGGLARRVPGRNADRRGAKARRRRGA